MKSHGNKLKSVAFVIALAFAGSVSTFAQQTAQSPQPIAGSSQVSAPKAVPQINPIIHRLTGIKFLKLLRRNGIKVAPLSDESLLKNTVQTNIIAGLSLGDGNIVALVPRAELEASFASSPVQVVPGATSDTPKPEASMYVLARDGRELALKLRGIDGGTGISLLSAENSNLATPSRDAKEETLVLGQHLRIVYTSSAPLAEGINSSDVFVNISVLEGKLAEITRGFEGKVTRLSLSFPGLSDSCLGGVAINDIGETIGFVEAINGTDALIIPIGAVRRAIQRILLGLDNNPRPWLGARGISVRSMSLEELELNGWNRGAARKLIANQVGVLLTAVPPQTPAWNAKLRVGDVVTRVNRDEVKSAEEFSTLLAQAGNAQLRFTVITPRLPTPRMVNVRLSSSSNPVLEMEAAEERASRVSNSDPFIASGIETLPMTVELASRFKATGGLFVVYVQLGTPAARAGVVAGDIIQSVDNQIVTGDNFPQSLPTKFTLEVVREGQRLAIQIDASTMSPH